MAEVLIPQPFAHQLEVIDAPHTRKLWQAGRRTGKTRGDFYAAIVGHGPVLPDGSRLLPGIVSGLDVAWLAPDFVQAMGIWREEIVPRFKGVAGIRVNEQDHCVSIRGAGSLWMKSHENARSIRGLGKNLGGLIVDEGAHFDLESDWTAVLVAALADHEGWAIFSSTTNSGPDGNPIHKAGPSFFNRLCGEQIAGSLGPEWGLWHHDARSNPKISASAFGTMVEECSRDERRLQEEVYANLLTAGAGLCFPEWQRRIHVQALEPARDWDSMGGMDWGYGSKGWFGLCFFGPNGQMLLRHELYFDHMLPSQVGAQVARVCADARMCPELIALDSACWNVTDGSATIAEKLQGGIDAEIRRINADEDRVCWTPQLVPAPKGPQAIQTQKTLTHEVLYYVEAVDGGTATLVQPPRLRVHPDCAEYARTVAVLPLDRRDPNKFDTDTEDHCVQGFGYLLAAREPEYRPDVIPMDVQEARKTMDTLSRRESDIWLKIEIQSQRTRDRYLARRQRKEAISSSSSTETIPE